MSYVPPKHRQHPRVPVSDMVPDRHTSATTGSRLFLFTLRRMASAGVDDAHAANALLGHFGKSYRRPLILMRAMMLELSRVSNRRISVAACCCARITPDEARLLEAVATAQVTPHSAYENLATVLDSPVALGALTCAQAVAQSFADLARPIALYGGD